MSRKWLWCVVAVAAGAIVWNEYRLWTSREGEGFDREYYRSPALKHGAASEQPTGSELAIQQAYDPIARAGEEESEVTVIDLTWLQRQTIEPPAADTEEPATLPAVLPAVFRPQPNDLVIPADFWQHSADGTDCCAAQARMTGVWRMFLGWIWSDGGGEECEPRNPMIEQLFVLPRPAEPYHCPETSVCPYLNGTAGQHYRK
jgi:hypothetical protein